MNSFMINIIFSLILSFLITFYLIPFFCIIAQRLQFVDRPDGIIKKHKTAIPYLGGVAIFCGFLIALAFVCPANSQLFLLLIGLTILLFVGLLDDIVVMRPLQKLFGQLIATFCFLKAGLYLKEHFFFNFWNIPISALWILSIINAFNFVDVMDGLASLIALAAAIIFFIIALCLQLQSVMPLLGAFIGALSAFFLFNRPDAKIYLGDAGSLFIGGFLAVIPFFFNWGAYNQLGYLTPIIVLSIPLLEITSLVLIRSYKGIPFYKGSPDHFSLYLQARGWKKVSILWYIAVLYLLLCGASLLFVTGKISFWLLLIMGILFLINWFLNL
ncbi:undecaprenyl/decaprenyl-phosphate alpha-N-acetylglucosaminyl 1-phosphate transferase [Candidatus Dependentiae bacterium]|nr:MAG: undecaprenyl/decaprenyl-phosphate alpha-N-acetylglucosaminyl 1-phosphate transferase [Candidatus Dependentiae bacterium]